MTGNLTENNPMCTSAACASPTVETHKAMLSIKAPRAASTSGGNFRFLFIAGVEYLKATSPLSTRSYPTGSDLPRDEHRIRAAEGEGVRHHRRRRWYPARALGDIVEIAFGVAAAQMRGGWHHPAFNGHHCDDEFECACCPEQMPVHGFCRTDRTGRGSTESFLYRSSFHAVVRASTRSVRVDIADVRRRKAR